MARTALHSPLAHEIAQDALESAKRNKKKRRGRPQKNPPQIDYKRLANALGVPPTSIWFCLNQKRAWPVDRWLYALQALGCLSFQGDHIIISSPKFKNYQKAFNEIETL